MAACLACGFEYEGSFKFCPECGTPLGAPARPIAEERKLVTCLFCDLVGFTATSSSADPEDVERMLATYFQMAKAQIESHGGVLRNSSATRWSGSGGLTTLSSGVLRPYPLEAPTSKVAARRPR